MRVILGIALGVMSVYVYNDVVRTMNHFGIAPKIKHIIYPDLGIADVIVGNCKDEAGMNGHGWHFIKRDYYQCNGLQIYLSDLIYGATNDKSY